MTAGLITDRIKADQAAAIAPIPAASTGAPASVPGAAGQRIQQAAQLPQGQDQGASAALVAVTPPPPAAGNGAKAPGPASQTATGASVPAMRAPTAAARSAPPAGTAISGQAVLTPSATSAAAAERVANGHLPALPTQAPPRPGIAPAPPPPLAPLTAAPPLAAPGAGGTGVDFSRGSATLNDPALAEVKALAAARGDRGIAVTGYGDAISSDALAQSEAAGLGLSRAQALATALVTQGVPYSMLRLNAEAVGRGASLRLLQ